MSKANNNRRYRVTNWESYNKSLIKRGSLTIWMEDDFAKKWHANNTEKQNGHPLVYSDDAILMALTLRFVYNLPLRALQGFIQSIFFLLHLSLKIPSYTQICRRAVGLGRAIKRLSKRTPTDLVFDSTGLKVYGEGEWKVRTHGISKRRTWRKLHIAMDPSSGEIIFSELTDNSKGDAQVAEEMMDQVSTKLENVHADGAYDSIKLLRKIKAKGATSKIPPPRNAVFGDPVDEAVRERNAAISAIEELGGDDAARAQWKKLTGYHKRSLVETTMFRYKQIFGGNLRSRLWENQQVEARLKCMLLNEMTRIGMPEGYWEELECVA